jgi:gingipain R
MILFTVEVAGQQWIGASSQSPSSPKIISSGSTSNLAEISVEIPGFYQMEKTFEGQPSFSIELSGGQPILKKGSPDLQKVSFTLQLPANGNLEASLESSKYYEYTDIDILPSAGNIVRDAQAVKLIKGEPYSNDAFYPGNFIDQDQPFIVRNSRAQAFQVYPLQYNPVTRILRFYYQLTFKLINTVGEGSNPLNTKDNNIRQIDGISASCINIQSAALKSGQLPSERGCMLVICPKNFETAIEPLVEWRKQTGIATEVVDATQFSGSDAIYDFVKNYYYNHGNLAYLLLVGDDAQVPTHELSSGSSDNYYSYLAGNDHYPDILVGRFSAESVKDVQVQVARTLEYEKNPAADASWLTNATGLGSTLSPGDDGESDFQHIRNLLKTLETTTYSKVNEFFDGSQGEGDADGNPASSDVSVKINQGTGIVFYAGHGSPSTMVTGSITKSMVEGLNNTGKYPLIWAAACEIGNFAEKYCIAESWMRATNGNGQPTGALAALMSSATQTSFPPMEAQDKIAEILSNPQQGLSTMGAISVKGMMSMNDKYGSAGYATTDNWILFGDPSLNVRTATPKEFIVDHKGTIGSGRTFYTLKCNSAEGYACISKDGIILGTAAIVDGMATIYLDEPASGESLTLTITSINYLPYIDTLYVIEKPGTPEFCSPMNHSKLQLINSSFSWDSGDCGNPDYYFFYLGTDNPPSNLVNGEKMTVAQFKAQFNFEYNQTYYWKVVPVNSYGKADGKVMDFSTVFAPDEDFEPLFKSRLQWTDGGSQKWSIDRSQYFDGKNSIRSGIIGDNENSSLIYPCDVTSCDFVSFWSKTSSAQGDKLQFIIDGSTLGEWSGISDWTFHIYKVEPGNHQIEWRYKKDNSGTAGEDAAWLDNIHLPLHAPAFASVNESGSVCSGSVFETSATAKNYFTLSWQTEGDGTFEDNDLENASYSPGILDAQNSVTTLKMLMKGFDGCPVTEKSVTLHINPLPVITLPSDTIISSENEIQLDATTAGENTYNWLPGGNTTPTAIIDPASSANGAFTANVTVTSAQGCSATKNITVHFNNPSIADSYTIYPNPSNGNFTLQPAKGSAVIDQMTLTDGEGRIVWHNGQNCSIVGSKQMSINGLANGTYFLVTESNNGRSVNPLLIQ